MAWTYAPVTLTDGETYFSLYNSGLVQPGNYFSEEQAQVICKALNDHERKNQKND